MNLYLRKAVHHNSKVANCKKAVGKWTLLSAIAHIKE